MCAQKLLRGCQRIDILSKIEAFSQNKHSYIFDIASISFFGNNEKFGQKGILGQALDVREYFKRMEWPYTIPN